MIVGALGCGGAREPSAEQAARATIIDRASEGDVTLEVMQFAVAKDECFPLPGLQPTLRKLLRVDDRKRWANALHNENSAFGSPSRAYGAWLVLAQQHLLLCDEEGDLSPVLAGAQPLNESQVDGMLEEKRCSALAATAKLDLWPFERRFADEVWQGNHRSAEVTRRVWLDTLTMVAEQCPSGLTRRDRIALDSQRDKLRRIVGLDDETLVDLRRKLLVAMDENEPDAVLAYTRAVAEREKALDALTSAELEGRIKTIEGRVGQVMAAQQQQQQQAQSQASVGLDDVVKGVETTRKVLSIFGL